jgi:5-deoxy-glucuronate isomerase
MAHGAHISAGLKCLPCFAVDASTAPRPVSLMSIDQHELFFSSTASWPGRHLAVSPANSPLEHLHYGRIRLDARRVEPAESGAVFDTGPRETALLCMQGQCQLRVSAPGSGDTRRALESIALGLYDAVYIPRGWSVEVSTDTEVDLVECAAEVAGDYPLQVVRYSEVAQTPSLKFSTGSEASRRDLNILIGNNVQAGRIVAGFTRSAPGHWTSWPPHEHAAILEEAYVYFDMPKPAFGVQLVYGGPEHAEFAKIVRDGDAVVMPAGYHPNVAAPGHSINFIWMMAARTEVTDRRFGVVNIEPGFAANGSGLEASRK